MNCYKMPYGIPFDAKLAVISRRTGLRRGEVLALWVALLDHGARALPRGSVYDIDAEELAALLEFETAAVELALSAFRDKKMITAQGCLAGWEKTQNVSTPRTRAHRAFKRESGLPEEDDAARRLRLQNEIIARHRRRGRTVAE